MTKIAENTIEEFAIKLLERLGYQYQYAPNIAPDGDQRERSSYEEVLLSGRLCEAIARINPDIPLETQDQALKEIQRKPTANSILRVRKALHRFAQKNLCTKTINHNRCLPLLINGRKVV